VRGRVWSYGPPKKNEPLNLLARKKGQQQNADAHVTEKGGSCGGDTDPIPIPNAKQSRAQNTERSEL